MKIPIKGKDSVTCPRTQEICSATQDCKKCYYLGWVMEYKVTCRWSQQKEDIITGKKYYEI